MNMVEGLGLGMWFSHNRATEDTARRHGNYETGIWFLSNSYGRSLLVSLSIRTVSLAGRGKQKKTYSTIRRKPLNEVLFTSRRI